MEDGNLIAIVVLGTLITLVLFYFTIRLAVRSANKEQTELLRQQNALLMTMLDLKEEKENALT